MENIGSYLPPGDGLLPKWLLLISVVSMGNSIQAYSSLKATQRVYAGKPSSNPSATPASTSPVTGLSGRTFGTWTFITSIVRLYAAYNIENKLMYELALWTFVCAWAHFMSEWFVFRTARWGAGLAGPVFVSTGTLTWMYLQWSSYIQA